MSETCLILSWIFLQDLHFKWIGRALIFHIEQVLLVKSYGVVGITHFLPSVGENLVAFNISCPANKLPAQRWEDQYWLK